MFGRVITASKNSSPAMDERIHEHNARYRTMVSMISTHLRRVIVKAALVFTTFACLLGTESSAIAAYSCYNNGNSVCVDEFSLVSTPASEPMSIIEDGSGNYWFTQVGDDRIGKMTPGGVISEYSISNCGNCWPSDIIVGPEGNLWFTETNASFIGQMALPGGVYAGGYQVPNTRPASLAQDSSRDLWFTETGANAIGEITPSGAVYSYPIKTGNSVPYGITVDTYDNVWFTEQAASKIGVLSSELGTIEELSVGTNAQPSGIASDSNGYVWFTESASNQIGKATLFGMVTTHPTIHLAALYKVPTPHSQPLSIVWDKLNSGLWFTEFAGNKIGLMQASNGAIVEYPVPTANSGLSGVAAYDPGTNQVWFTEQNANQIGVLTFLEY